MVEALREKETDCCSCCSAAGSCSGSAEDEAGADSATRLYRRGEALMSSLAEASDANRARKAL